MLIFRLLLLFGVSTSKFLNGLMFFCPTSILVNVSLRHPSPKAQSAVTGQLSQA